MTGSQEAPGTGSAPDLDRTLERLVAWALAEDVGAGDWTTLWTVPEDRPARARVVAKAPLVVAGVDAAVRVFRRVDPDTGVDVLLPEGAAADAGEAVLRLSGRARSLLTAERTALNFLGRLSGIATLTRSFVRRVEGTGARVVDTRKTTPGWRLLEKAAVRAGGGENHRMGLHDMILIKENHIAAAGGLRTAVERVAGKNRASLPVEVEVGSLEELDEALEVGVDRILLDNMAPGLLSEAVGRVRGRDPRPELEASGNVTLDTVRSVAETGVDLISVGALTHSAPSADLSMLLEEGA